MCVYAEIWWVSETLICLIFLNDGSLVLPVLGGF